MYKLAIIGIITGFVFYLFTGLTAGGIIVPAYFALYMFQPMHILSTIILSLIAFFFVKLLSEYILLYGKRRFFIFILTGLMLKALCNKVFIFNPVYTYAEPIGYIIPGIIANEFYRQGILNTLISIIIVLGFLVFLVWKIVPGL